MSQDSDVNKSVGIVGYWYATNYGSVATYYALYSAIKALGYYPTLIDEPEKEKDPAGEDVFSRDFLKAHCNISPSVKWSDISVLNESFDSFVVGSDQVWTRDAIRIARYMFFLNFADENKRRIAYAPSFGTDRFDISLEEKETVAKCLRLFDAVSVREESGKDILSRMFNINADRVLDPVFLIDEKEYSGIAEKSTIDTSGQYILAYILDPTPDKEAMISKVQEKFNLPIKLVLDGRKGTYAVNMSKVDRYKASSLEGVNEYDWVRLFKDATYVVTDSHHGLAMAVIYHKEFVAYANRARGYARFTSLMTVLGLEDRLVDNSSAVDGLLGIQIDYNRVKKIIDSEKKRSLDWLKAALSRNIQRNNITCVMDLRSKCTGCSTCEAVCPKDAITMVANYDGFYNPSVDSEKCIDCGVCVRKCIALNPQYINSPNPECHAVMASDEIRKKSSSGGMFTLAAVDVMNDGGCVFGAAYGKDYTVKHIMVDNENGLDLIRGSKYIQSQLCGTYREVLRYLDLGKKVLFSGMPCHVAGLYSFLGKDYPNLRTIDILCHGISSHKVFKHYWEDVLQGKEIVDLQFKSKEPWGWHAGINAKFSDGTKYSVIIEKDPYFVAYIKGMSKNICCGVCPFNRLPRQGDITIGDFWLVQDFDKSMNDNLGTSVVLINNERGKDLFERTMPAMKLNEIVPISYAKKGNGIISYPYRLPETRDTFFDNLGKNEFDKLVSRLNVSLVVPRTYSVEECELFSIARYAFLKCRGRRIVLWGDNKLLRAMLLKRFHMDVPFIISTDGGIIDDKWVKHPNILKGKDTEFFVVCLEKAFDQPEVKSSLKGFRENEDYVCKMIRPIVLENVQLNGAYADNFGNTIHGHGIISKVIFRGFNNHIEIGSNVSGLQNLMIDVTANSRIVIGCGTNFTQKHTNINVQGYNGRARVYIGEKCRFMRSIMRLFTSWHESSITIGTLTTFGDNLRLHANSGKKIVIGEDCLFSEDIEVWAGDGHSIFDVNTENNINSDYYLCSPQRNIVQIGNHVWVGARAFILEGSTVGEGSIVGAMSVVKGHFPSNCTIYGNPSQIGRTDVAWSHGMVDLDMGRCGQYANKTKELPMPICGLNVLVIGGSQNNGRGLIESLLSQGNIVTVANRGKTSDNFGERISRRIILDVSDDGSVSAGLSGKTYDVVYNNLAYSSNEVRRILNAVKCKFYVQLSSVFVYPEFHEDLAEYEFEPLKEHFEWKGADADYRKGKQNAECASMQYFKDVPSVLVRLPYICWDKRLDYYCNHILREIPMNIEDLERRICFIRGSEVGKFLTWIPNAKFIGPINLSSRGSITVGELIRYIEEKTNHKAIVIESGDSSPYSDPSFTLNLKSLENLGFEPSHLDEWFWKEVDAHIQLAINEAMANGTKSKGGL